MSNSSPHTICWDSSTNYSSACIPDYSNITITGASDTITITGGISGYSSPYNSTGSSSAFTINTSSISTLATTLSGGGAGTSSTFSFQCPEDWVNQFPDWHRVEKMCEEYPGLKIAFEKFKTTYHLIKDHYDTPEDQRPRP
jgi:hypothetical protein